MVTRVEDLKMEDCRGTILEFTQFIYHISAFEWQNHDAPLDFFTSTFGNRNGRCLHLYFFYFCLCPFQTNGCSRWRILQWEFVTKNLVMCLCLSGRCSRVLWKAGSWRKIWCSRCHPQAPHEVHIGVVYISFFRLPWDCKCSRQGKFRILLTVIDNKTCFGEHGHPQKPNTLRVQLGWTKLFYDSMSMVIIQNPC